MIKMNQKMLQIKQKSDADYFELVKERLLGTVSFTSFD